MQTHGYGMYDMLNSLIIEYSCLRQQTLTSPFLLCIMKQLYNLVNMLNHQVHVYKVSKIKKNKEIDKKRNQLRLRKKSQN